MPIPLIAAAAAATAPALTALTYYGSIYGNRALDLARRYGPQVTAMGRSAYQNAQAFGAKSIEALDYNYPAEILWMYRNSPMITKLLENTGGKPNLLFRAMEMSIDPPRETKSIDELIKYRDKLERSLEYFQGYGRYPNSAARAQQEIDKINRSLEMWMDPVAPGWVDPTSYVNKSFNAIPEMEWAYPSSPPTSPSLGNFLPYLTGQSASSPLSYPFGGSIFDQPTSPTSSSWPFRNSLPLLPNPLGGYSADLPSPPRTPAPRLISIPSRDSNYLDMGDFSFPDTPQPTMSPAEQAFLAELDRQAALEAANMLPDPELINRLYGEIEAAPAQDSGSTTPGDSVPRVKQPSVIDYAGSAINTAYNVMSFGSTLQDVLTGRRSDPGAYLSLANSTAQGLNWLAKTDGAKEIVGAIGDLQGPLDKLGNVTGGTVAGWGLYQNIAGLANGEVNAQNVLGVAANSSALNQTAFKPLPARALALAA